MEIPVRQRKARATRDPFFVFIVPVLSNSNRSKKSHGIHEGDSKYAM
jgi:hypothetical protein